MRKNQFTIMTAIAVLASAGFSCAEKPSVRPELLEGPGWTMTDNNLHQIDGPPAGKGTQSAYRLYRSGAPSKETFAKWCEEYKIERVIVMAGNADNHELQHQAEGICTDIEVLYNVEQSHATPVSDGFLDYFDGEIKRAKADNVGILFRCTTGSHRAGRTAAYYQMKYQGLTADEAIAVMDHNGMLMPLFDPVLHPQVRAMDDYINGRPCSQDRKYCVINNSDKWVE